ncbi:ComEC/Rec2 family competence protein [Desulfosediminicola ganghwensis]|uniref:ComEC/Rec2 family competence protein n=1 Tax=Desulfosediminicola ganghwensis TaxID=2569540 RepID=UPI0010AD3001|nr:MBL fold metallo-hydrolase [Desulfosediminicola ganghwensis]
MGTRIACCLLLALIWGFSAVSVLAKPVDIYFADVGDGNATLLHQPGKCAMLVDAGPRKYGDEIAHLLKERGIETLDFVVITHPHKQLYGGLEVLFDSMKILELSDNGDMNESEDGYRKYSELQFHLPYSVLARGDSWKCGDMRIKVVHPSVAFAGGGDYTSRALALLVEFNDFRFLLFGDVSANGEERMLRSRQDLNSMVLQFGAGEENRISQTLLERVQPKVVIISGARPGRELVDQLLSHKIRTFATAEEGVIRMRVAENGNIRLQP